MFYIEKEVNFGNNFDYELPLFAEESEITLEFASVKPDRVFAYTITVDGEVVAYNKDSDYVTEFKETFKIKPTAKAYLRMFGKAYLVDVPRGDEAFDDGFYKNNTFIDENGDEIVDVQLANQEEIEAVELTPEEAIQKVQQFYVTTGTLKITQNQI
jgi:hypothetical protein